MRSGGFAFGALSGPLLYAMLRGMDLKAIQVALRERDIDGWLLSDFRNRDFLAYRVLGLDEKKANSRRWYYYIPSRGTPIRLVHAVERAFLDSLPGRKHEYVAWKELHASLEKLLGAGTRKKIAMQYSPKNNVPYVALTDAGTVELIKSFGHKVVSSADLVQSFVSVIDEAGYRSPVEAAAIVDRIRAEAFDQIRDAIASNQSLTEYDVQQFIMKRFGEEDLVTYAPPMVGINEHPSDPHFEVSKDSPKRFKPGDTVLIDLWAKKSAPGSIYYDITWDAYIGARPPAAYAKIFAAARDGRDAAIAFVQDAFRRGRTIAGWQVDDVCRNVVKKAGYAKHFLHRTGHSIGVDIHGTGVNIDNLETKDERALIPGCCFSIEPGIYLAGKMAVRTEINMFIRHDGEAEVTGEVQRELVLLA
jgi:Xaa-Pro dipeptidase